MSISQNELSVESSRPIELIEVSYTGNFYYYTSSDQDITLDGKVYLARPISHAEIEPSQDVEKAGLEFIFPRDIPFYEAFRIQPPSEVVSFTLKVQNYLIPSEFVVLWKGRVIDVNQQGAYVSVTVENVFSSLNRPGLRRRYSITCPYALYGSQCGVSRDAFKEILPISALSGLTLVVPGAIGKPDNYYAGGYATWANGVAGNVEKRMIRESFGTSGFIVLSALPIGLSGGQLVNLYAGCDHLIATCDSKFGNSLNCGATPYIPSKNPFGGSTVY